MIPSNMDYVQVKFNHHLQASFKNLARLRDNVSVTAENCSAVYQWIIFENKLIMIFCTIH